MFHIKLETINSIVNNEHSSQTTKYYIMVHHETPAKLQFMTMRKYWGKIGHSKLLYLQNPVQLILCKTIIDSIYSYYIGNDKSSFAIFKKQHAFAAFYKHRNTKCTCRINSRLDSKNLHITICWYFWHLIFCISLLCCMLLELL